MEDNLKFQIKQVNLDKDEDNNGSENDSGDKETQYLEDEDVYDQVSAYLK